jgi:hypothetical protein
VRATQVHVGVPPGIEVAPDIDATADRPSGVLLGVTDRPKLLEGLSAIDRGLVVASGLENVVIGTVAGNRSPARGCRRRIVRAIRLNHIVLDERIASPSVDSEVAVSVGVVGTAVVDGPGSYRISRRHNSDQEFACNYLLLLPGFHPFPPTRLPALPDH